MKTLALLVMGLFVLTACTPQAPPETNDTREPENPFLNPGYHEIVADNFMYTPKAITVYQGDRVKWINHMQVKQSVWIWGEGPSPLINPSKSWSFFFTEVGFFKYRDQFLQDMEGNVTVLPYEERPDVKARFGTGATEP